MLSAITLVLNPNCMTEAYLPSKVAEVHMEMAQGAASSAGGSQTSSNMVIWSSALIYALHVFPDAVMRMMLMIQLLKLLCTRIVLHVIECMAQ